MLCIFPQITHVAKQCLRTMRGDPQLDFVLVERTSEEPKTARAKQPGGKSFCLFHSRSTSTFSTCTQIDGAEVNFPPSYINGLLHTRNVSVAMPTDLTANINANLDPNACFSIHLPWPRKRFSSLCI